MGMDSQRHGNIYTQQIKQMGIIKILERSFRTVCLCLHVWGVVSYTGRAAHSSANTELLGPSNWTILLKQIVTGALSFKM